ncbi:MAG: histidine kinase [Bacteroidota bacterium]
MNIKKFVLLQFLQLLIFMPLLIQGQSSVNQSLKMLQGSKTVYDSIDASVTLVDLYLDRNPDSANYFMNIAKRLSYQSKDTFGIATYFLLKGKLFRKNLSYDSAISAYKESRDLSNAIDYQTGLCYANISLGYLYRIIGLADSSNYFFNQIFKSEKGGKFRTDALNGIALNFKSAGNYNKAQEYFFEILEDTPTDLHHERSAVYSNIGLVFEEQKMHKEADSYYRKSLEEAVLSGNTFSIGFSEKMLGSNFGTMSQFDSALHYYNCAFEKFKSINSLYQLASISQSLAYVHTNLENWKEADEKLVYCRSLLDREYNVFLELYYLKKLSYYQSNNPSIDLSKAVESINKAEEIAIDKDLTDEFMDIYQMKSAFLEKSNPVEALKYYKMYNEAKDSISSLNNKNYIAMLETTYETAQKDQAILNLQQEKAIDSLKLKQQQTYLFGAIGVSILILIGGFIFNRNRKLRHQSVLENMQYRLLRIQMNPHFIFNALMAIQNFMLKNNPLDAGIYLSKFAKLMRQTLENSREESISITEEKEMLESYIEIQQLRAENKFEYNINIDESLIEKGIRIPPMYAQPFIENAIEHGNLGEIKDGKLDINFEEKDNLLHVSIKDNGVGFDEKVEKSGHKSLSTIITRERLDLLEKRFKIKLGFSISSSVEKMQQAGTQVRFILPMLYS